MKQSPEEYNVTERMRAGVSSRDGFLGGDQRPLSEILATDLAAVEAMGVSHVEIAVALEAVVAHAMAAYGARVTIAGHLTAVYHEAMGRIRCPFGDGLYAKGDVELTDTRTAVTVHVPPLAVHMIELHGFYQGRGSRYRVDPATLCKMLDIATRSG